MGQAQSYAAATATATVVHDQTMTHAETKSPSSSSSSSNPASTSSMDALIAEAAAYGGDENESLEAKAQKALECPCIADLQTGPCGSQFSNAFLCFMKSTAEEKGSDCVHPFVALQNCIKANPNAFSKDVLEDEEEEVKDVKKEEEPKQEFSIIPPRWSREPQSPKSKL